MKLIKAGNKGKGEKERSVYFVSLKRRGVMKVKTKLKTYEVNNSVTSVKYEGSCLSGKFHAHTASDNNLQMIDRSFLSRFPTQ